jgi:hypothetical protein
MKTCTRCHCEKELTEFRKKAASKDGLHSWCKVCHSADVAAYNKKVYAENPDEAKRKFREKRRRQRQTPHQWCSHILVPIRNRALEKGVSCTITAQHLRDIWPMDNRCPILKTTFLCGMEKGNPAGPSVDRIVPSLGYVPGNVAIISYRANRIKIDATILELRAVADWMVQMGCYD